MKAIKICVYLICTSLCMQACATSLVESNPNLSVVSSLPVTQSIQMEVSASPDLSPPSSTVTPSQTQTELDTTTPTATITLEPSATVKLEPSTTITPSLTASPIPTYGILRGVVLPEKVSCRYGPGAMYLYLYGMVKTATQDIIGRTDSGAWVLTRAHGDDKACWVKSEFLEIDGDVMSLEIVYPDKFRIPPSNQGYRLPWNVVAARNGNEVTISWESEERRPGDEESATSVLYVVETWVCKDGQLMFTPIGAYVPQVSVTDEPGCEQASHGRVFFSEKHGYTGPTEINWPPAP